MHPSCRSTLVNIDSIFVVFVSTDSTAETTQIVETVLTLILRFLLLLSAYPTSKKRCHPRELGHCS